MLQDAVGDSQCDSNLGCPETDFESHIIRRASGNWKLRRSLRHQTTAATPEIGHALLAVRLSIVQ